VRRRGVCMQLRLPQLLLLGQRSCHSSGRPQKRTPTAKPADMLLYARAAHARPVLCRASWRQYWRPATRRCRRRRPGLHS
jgi:hypothetical protein